MTEEGYKAVTKLMEGTKKSKSISEQSDKELELANWNSRALGTLLNGWPNMSFIKLWI